MAETYKSNIEDLSFDFWLQTIEIYNFLKIKKKEYTLSRQILKSWTSIWANVREAKA